MRRSIGIWSASLVLAASLTPARASLVVSIGSTTIAQGGTGSINVDITNAGSSSVQINQYGFQLQITPNTNVFTQLAFSAPTSSQLSYLSDATLTTPYVFLGDSADAQPPAFVGGPGQTIYHDDTFNASDSTLSGNPVTIAAGQTFLLAILPITTATQLPPGIDDSFSVSLMPGSGDGSIGPNHSNTTFFDVFNFDTFQELSATAFSSSPGAVRIVGSAVPEPSSLILAATAAAVALLLRPARLGRRD